MRSNDSGRNLWVVVYGGGAPIFGHASKRNASQLGAGPHGAWRPGGHFWARVSEIGPRPSRLPALDPKPRPVAQAFGDCPPDGDGGDRALNYLKNRVDEGRCGSRWSLMRSSR